MTSRRAQRRALERRQEGALVRAERPSRSLLEGRPVVDQRELVRVSARLLLQTLPNDGGGGFTAFHRAERVQVPVEWRRPPILALPLYCYEVAMDFVLRHADQPVTLVHGVVWEPGEPGGVPLPWSHAWVELEGDGLAAVFDPATGLYYQRSSYYEVLAARRLASYSAAEADARLAATGRLGLWADALPAHRALVAACLEEIAAAVPDLAGWVEKMLQADDRFAANWRQVTAHNEMLAVHLQATLAQYPQWWREHHPGEEWPYHRYLFRDAEEL
jgi:hypothetical protein